MWFKSIIFISKSRKGVNSFILRCPMWHVQLTIDFVFSIAHLCTPYQFVMTIDSSSFYRGWKIVINAILFMYTCIVAYWVLLLLNGIMFDTMYPYNSYYRTTDIIYLYIQIQLRLLTKCLRKKWLQYNFKIN